MAPKKQIHRYLVCSQPYRQTQLLGFILIALFCQYAVTGLARMTILVLTRPVTGRSLRICRHFTQKGFEILVDILVNI